MEPHAAARRRPLAGLQADVLVIGGGPAGLTAAIYLARFHINVIVADRGGSRASLIPMTRNHAGFPDGISGVDLVNRMRDQAVRYGARIIEADLTDLRQSSTYFTASYGSRSIQACSVLLATGVTNIRPAMGDAIHDRALRRGLLRYCPICDGFEVTDSRVAVIGTGERGLKEALFLRSFTADVSLLAQDGPHAFDHSQRERLAAAGIRLVDGPCGDITIDVQSIAIASASGRLVFDAAYPALGSRIHSELARPLGLSMSEDGCIVVDAHQRTDIAGLYAAGDVVKGLDQISHAMGEGGVAATTIRNDLAESMPLRR